MPLEVCNLDKPFRRYHVCTEDWSTAGRTHSAGQEGIWLRSAFSRTDPAARPHRPSREAMDHDRPRTSHHGRPRRPTTSLTRSTRAPRTKSPLMQFRLFLARFTSTDLWKT
ncbi:unnamed protein product [Microthlaspi erraticum]|uniref:Uncharacterized protein n=1 Tax=Microthlaspi erraticum TaxID=1685480 RepID=A0A6D2IF50_9BRAS|nr:unnamed protein product [Microthlaspi erraticum]